MINSSLVLVCLNSNFQNFKENLPKIKIQLKRWPEPSRLAE
ncbi:hypothetical protein DOT_3285 [Desulfosporosinus sp. OT]|nr:hypothetical protein DOT_3285 [Desulfosporosinus sp. OT]